MFIEITTPANPLRIENTLRPYKKGKKPFSPKVARKILSSTNNHKNIRDTLQIIAALPTAEQAQYKEIVIAAFDHRNQLSDTTILAKKLAIANNYEEELNQIINHDPMTDTINGIIYASATNEIAAYICADEKPTLRPFATIYCTSNRIYFSNIDFSLIKKLKVKKNCQIHLYRCQSLPKELDISMCSKVNLFKTDISQTQTITFKNKTQQQESKVKISENWQGKITYTDDINNTVFRFAPANTR